MTQRLLALFLTFSSLLLAVSADMYNNPSYHHSASKPTKGPNAYSSLLLDQPLLSPEDKKRMETRIYLRVVQEMAFNVWSGFLDGYYQRDGFLKRNRCMND